MGCQLPYREHTRAASRERVRENLGFSGPEGITQYAVYPRTSGFVDC